MNLQRITASADDRFVDEIVVDGVDIHLVRMTDGVIWIGIYRPDTEDSLHVNLWAIRKDELVISTHWSGDSWPDVSQEHHGIPPEQLARLREMSVEDLVGELMERDYDVSLTRSEGGGPS